MKPQVFFVCFFLYGPALYNKMTYNNNNFKIIIISNVKKLPFCNYCLIAICTIKCLEVLELLTYVFFLCMWCTLCSLAEQILHIWTYK